ncbi:hypothetical protein HYV58_01395, partial [Candidatus Peregrinibacteria bacterium]|nr:hypothetical protein [Candidatus Peregrinibacteria bacterium]
KYPKIDSETLDQVLLLSLGRSGRALQLLGNPEMFQEVRDLYRHIQFLDEKAGFATRFQSMHELAQNPEKLKTFLTLLSHYFREKMLRSPAAEECAHAVDIIEKTHRTIDLLAGNVNERLALEYIMLGLRAPSKTAASGLKV